ncbi:hypothetical protein [Corynebacterium bovis]|uniref:hypothetical protein n=1 Tax=Corynebacterium bovis TaxID=36808 RepID=UPI000F64B9EF|nr:hypothetical protein [Corynebacterium bovis]RRO79595.1 hypothetical protein CXF38_08945 [Corynebacterium bovis]RRO82473.1 hypothetical protein CXF37_06705 [Corynebacterium bovis]RRO88308.1 hypothetical protein CXF45_09465 [Corynebacterium bovis]
MNTDIRWALPDDGHTFPIYAGPTTDMDRVAEYSEERGVSTIRFGGDTWSLTADKGPEASAATMSGTFTATGDAATFARSRTVRCVADRHTVTVEAESRRQFVLDIDGVKSGQFTSENRGLKNLHVQFEGPGEALPLDVQVFLSWVARRCMETRVLNGTLAWTVGLIILVPFMIAVFMGLL